MFARVKVISEHLTVSYLDTDGSLLGTAMSLYEVRVNEGGSSSICAAVAPVQTPRVK